MSLKPVSVLSTSVADPEVGSVLDDGMIMSTNALDQTIGDALRLSREKRVVHHPSQRQDDIFHVTDGAQELRDRAATSCSLVTCLPPEILAYIFRFYLVRETGSVLAPVPGQGPLCLARVCKLWRAIVESEPHLWTSIYLYFPESSQHHEEDLSKVKPVFELHMKRSGVLPISLTLADYRAYHSPTEHLILFLVDRLRAHAHRWNRITAHISCGYFPFFFPFTQCDLSSLEHLYISGDEPTHRFAGALTLSLDSATKLKSFTYSGPGHAWGDKIDLHWETLLEISFDFVPHYGRSNTLSRQFLHLARCQNVTTCSLGIDRPISRLNNGQSITLPSLQTLRVRRLSAESRAHCVIDPLILPQLETLEIDSSCTFHWGWEHPWHHHSFSDLLVRSGCTLRHLSIQDVQFQNDELLRCLSVSPSLTSFRFIPFPRSQNIISVINKLDVSRSLAGAQTRAPEHSQGRRRPLLPQLCDVTLASSEGGYLGSMMEMFRSRTGARVNAAGVSALRRVDVVFFNMWHDADIDRINVPGTPLEPLEKFRMELARWVSESENEGETQQDKDKLQASVVVDSPYHPEYIDVEC